MALPHRATSVSLIPSNKSTVTLATMSTGKRLKKSALSSSLLASLVNHQMITTSRAQLRRTIPSIIAMIAVIIKMLMTPRQRAHHKPVNLKTLQRQSQRRLKMWKPLLNQKQSLGYQICLRKHRKPPSHLVSVVAMPLKRSRPW